MATLLKGNGATLEGAQETRAASSTPASTDDSSTTWHELVRGSLVLGDLLLVTMAAWLVLTTNRPLGWVGTLLCVAAMLLGAWMSCLALNWPRNER